jgi:PAS domain S-box-containing protein
LGVAAPESPSRRPDSTRSPGGARRDPAEYLRAELYQRVREDSEIFDFLQNGSLDGIWYWDLDDSAHEWMSPRLKDVFGYADEEIPNTPQWWQANIFPEDRDLALENFRRHCADPAHPYDQIVRYRHKDGSTVWVRCRGLAIRDEAGVPHRMLGAHTDVTAIKKVEQRLQALHAAAPDMRVSVDPIDGRILDCSETFAEALGRTKLDLLDTDLSALWHPDSVSRVAAALASYGEAGRAADVEATLRRPDGGSVSVVLAPRPGDLDGRPTIELYCRDVGHLRKLPNVVVFVESLPGAALVVDAASTITTMSPAAERMFGRPRAELIGAPIGTVLPGLALVPGQRGAPGRPALATAIELTAVRPGGSSFSAEVSAGPLPTEDGLVSLVEVLDVSQRKAAEEEVRDSEYRFRQMTESLAQLVWTTTADGSCDYLSSQWVAYTGIEAQEQLGHGWLRQVHPDDRPALERSWRQAIAGGLEFQSEFRLRSRHGAYRWFDTRAVPLRRADGQLVRWFGTNTDVTERREAEEHRLRSQKLEALGTLAGGIAHDFNNILTAIIGNLQLALLETTPADPAYPYLAEIEKASNRAADLARRILSYGRPKEDSREVTKLGPIVDEALRLLRATLPSLIEIRVAVPDDLPPVAVDPSQLHQVLMNLGVNASHAMADRSGLLELRATALDPDVDGLPADLPPVGWVRLSVRDNGCGMPPEISERIFDPYFSTKGTQGTGLGLSMVHSIMIAHGGTIAVSSTPGVGTVFDLFFPAATEIAGPLAPVRAETAGQRLRVLLVDDESPIVSTGRDLLVRLGHRVTAADHPATALEIFARAPHEVDVAVVDLTMPEMSGLALATALRALRPGLPIVLSTGLVTDDTTDAARRIGIDATVGKPYSVTELSAALHDAVRRHPGNGS